MRSSLFSIAAAATLAVSAGVASAQTSSTTTTTTWTNDEGQVIRQYSTTQHYQPVQDPSMQVTVGSTLPQSVEVYSLPESMQVPDRDRYSYTIVNNQPVVVERTTRRVVHTWSSGE